MNPSYILLCLLLAVNTAIGHMSMVSPPPLRYPKNPYAKSTGKIDWEYSSPLASEGKNFPCKGYHIDMGTPGGHPVVEYVVEGIYNISLIGTTPHGGGSCQIALSHDKGGSFGVIKSYIGDCVRNDTSGNPQEFSFTVPDDTPVGDALLSWTWFNNVGNREMYMNCAAVKIVGSHSKKRSPSGSIYSRRTTIPPLFAANIGNGCSTVPNKDVDFPSPGRDVTYSPNTNRAPPEGDCGPVGVGSGEDIEINTTNRSVTGVNNTNTISPPTTSGAADETSGSGRTPWEDFRANRLVPTWWLFGAIILWAFVKEL